MKIRYLLLMSLAVFLMDLSMATEHWVEGALPGKPDGIARRLDRSQAPVARTNVDPNVLIIMTDDQRASWDGLKVMDNLQRLFGDQGTRFPNAVATTPLCCPSRASIFTGKYVHNHGVTTQKNATNMPQAWTIQYQLKRHGYTTALVGKYLNNWSGPKPHLDHVRGGIFTDYYNRGGVYTTHAIRENSISLLKNFEAKDEKPWLMYVYPFAPHTPSIPEKKHEDAYVPPWRNNPARSEKDLGDKPLYIKNRAAKTSLTDEKRRRRNMIRTLYSVDDMISAIFKKINRLGEDNTIAFFLSDNGWMWFEHRLDRKEVAYDDSVRIPMYVRWPGHVQGGVRDPRIVANIDIAPTVYDAADVTPQGYQPDGKSMFTSNRDHVLTEFRASNPWRALWHPKWMYVEYDNGFREYYGTDDPWQLD
ncbi:MAG: sulfatase-like hydrolase/transferase, partial [Actinomycetota bacterium]